MNRPGTRNTPTLVRRLAIAAILLLGTTGVAQAACYDVFGCTNQNVFRFDDLASGPNCEFLYTMRNQIYQEHGYCFQTARARATFSNQGCDTSSQTVVAGRLNRIEATNAATILRAEQYKGCPL